MLKLKKHLEDGYDGSMVGHSTSEGIALCDLREALIARGELGATTLGD